MAVTIKQIAEAAGVSRGTVDRALNNRSGINPEVAKRVREIAAELHYEPNAVAKALAHSQRKVQIGVLTNSKGNPFFDKVLRGIARAEREIRSFGVSLIQSELTGYNPEEQLAEIDRIAAQKPEGLVITPINDPRVIDRLNELAAAGIRIVALNTDVPGLDKLCFVGCDYLQSGRTAAELLGQMTQSELRVSIVTGSFRMLGHNQRIEGFRTVLEQDYPRIRLVSIIETEDDNRSAYQQVGELLREDPPDALYFCAGGVAGGLRAVEESGLAGKLKIITVDDTDDVKNFLRWKLINATVCQQPVKQGYESVMTLFRFLTQKTLPKSKQRLTQNEVKLRYNIE